MITHTALHYTRSNIEFFDIAALCLSSWPATIFTQPITSDTLARLSQSASSAVTFLTTVNEPLLTRRMTLHQIGVVTTSLTVHSSMVPDISVGQTYFEIVTTWAGKNRTTDLDRDR